MPLVLNDVSFTVRTLPDLASVRDAAGQVCSRGEQIGVKAEDVPACIEDVVLYIRQLYTKAYLEAQEKRQLAQQQAESQAQEQAAAATTDNA